MSKIDLDKESTIDEDKIIQFIADLKVAECGIQSILNMIKQDIEDWEKALKSKDYNAEVFISEIGLWKILDLTSFYEN